MLSKRLYRLILTALFTWSSIAMATPICVPGENGTLAVAPLSDSSSQLLNGLATETKSMLELATNARFNLFESPVSPATQPALTVESELQSIRNQINNELIQFASSNNSPFNPALAPKLHNLIAQYLEAAFDFTEMSAYSNPYSITAFLPAQQRVALQIPTPVWMILNLEKPIPFAAIIQYLPSAVRVSLSPESIYIALREVAARSEMLQMQHKAIFEVTRCALSDAMVAQYFAQESIRGIAPEQIQLPIAPATPACLALPIGELENLQRHRLGEQSEGQFRSGLIEQTFSPDKVESPQLIQNLNNFNLNGPDLLALIWSPETSTDINPNLNAQGAGIIDAQLAQAVQSAEKNVAYFSPLMNMTASPAFQEIINGMISSCNLSYSPQNISAMSAAATQKMNADLLYKLDLSEGVLGLNLGDFVKFYTGHLASLSQLDPTSVRNALRQMLIYKKYSDAREILQSFFELKTFSETPSATQLVDRLSGRLYKIAVSTVDQALAQPAVAQWFNNIVNFVISAKANQSNDSNPTFLPQRQFDRSAVQLAMIANFVHNPKTPLSKILFYPNLMAETRQAALSTVLTGLNKDYFKLTLNQTTPAEKKAVWQVVKQKINQKAQFMGTNCHTDSKFVQDAKVVAAWAEAFTIQIPQSQKSIYHEQCSLMSSTAKMMGLELPQVPQTLQGIVPVLNQVLGARQAQKAIATYRELLIKQILSSTRFLLMRYSWHQKNKTAPYVYQVVAEASQNPDKQRGIINWSLQYSSSQLAKTAKKYLIAHDMAGLTGLFKDSNGAAGMLGDAPAAQQAVVAEGDAARRYDPSEINYEIYQGAKMDFISAIQWIWGMQILGAFWGRAAVWSARLDDFAGSLFSTPAIMGQLGIDWAVQRARIGENSGIKLSNINGMYWSQGFKASGVASFMNDGMYSRETAILAQENHQARVQKYVDYGIGGVVAGASAFATFGDQIANRMVQSGRIPFTVARRIRALKMAELSGDSEKVTRIEESISKSASRQVRRLGTDMRALDNPASFRLSALKSGLRKVQFSPESTQEQIFRAQEAYQRIIRNIGRRVEVAEAIGRRANITDISTKASAARYVKIYANSLRVGEDGTALTSQELIRLHNAAVELANGGVK